MSTLAIRTITVIWRYCAVVLAAAFIAGCGEAKDGDSASVTHVDSTPATSEGASLGEGSKRMLCERGFIGAAPADWRTEATSVGPIGLAGLGRDFSRIPNENSADDLLHTKIPVVVEGHGVVELVVPAREGNRVALEVDQGGPYERLIFISCRDKPRTMWAAGLALRDRSPVTLEARWGQRSGSMRVGKIAP